MTYSESVWEGFKRLDFQFEEHDAILILPEKAEYERRWMLKTEYFGAFPNAELAMLGEGWHLAYLANDNRWGVDADQHRKARFARFLREEFGLSEKCVPVGMSCGGLHGIMLASLHPEIVSALYLDAPVVNLLSCPFRMGVGPYSPRDGESGSVKEVFDAWGLDRASLLSFRNHPLDRLDRLIEAKIPVLMIYGMSDDIVPYAENGALMEARWREAGLEFEAVGKPGCGHHPHGLEDPAPIVRFMKAH